MLVCASVRECVIACVLCDLHVSRRAFACAWPGDVDRVCALRSECVGGVSFPGHTGQRAVLSAAALRGAPLRTCHEQARAVSQGV